MYEIINVKMCCNIGETDITEYFKMKFNNKTIKYDRSFIDLYKGHLKYLNISFVENDTISNCKIIQGSHFPPISKREIIEKLEKLKITEHKIYDFIKNFDNIILYSNHLIIGLIDFNNNKCLICARPTNKAGLYCYVNYYKSVIKHFYKLGLQIELCHNDAFPLYKNNVDDKVYNYIFKTYDTIQKIDNSSIIKKYFSPSDNVINNIIFLKLKYKIDPNNFIGVVFRGTDKITECKLPKIETYIKKINNLLTINKNLKILIQTDEEYVYKQFFETFGNKVIAFKEIPRSHNNKNVFHSNIDDKLKTIMHFDSAIRIISECKYILTNNSSNITSMIESYKGNTMNIFKIKYEHECEYLLSEFIKNCNINIINLEHRIDKKEFIISQFKKIKCENYKFFKAIKHKNTICGCLTSHKQIIFQNLNSNNHLLIAEDDFFFTEDFFQLNNDYYKLFENLNDDWDILFFYNKGYTNSNIPKIKLSGTSGTHFYIINKKSINKVFDLINSKNNMTDIDKIYKQLSLEKQIKSYTCNNILIAQNCNLKSDILNQYRSESQIVKKYTIIDTLDKNNKNINIINVTYGTKEKFINITDKFKNLFIANNQFSINNKTFTDPHPGKLKYLIINYIDENNEKITKTFKENTVFNNKLI